MMKMALIWVIEDFLVRLVISVYIFFEGNMLVWHFQILIPFRLKYGKEKTIIFNLIPAIMELCLKNV